MKKLFLVLSLMGVGGSVYSAEQDMSDTEMQCLGEARLLVFAGQYEEARPLLEDVNRGLSGRGSPVMFKIDERPITGSPNIVEMSRFRSIANDESESSDEKKSGETSADETPMVVVSESERLYNLAHDILNKRFDLVQMRWQELDDVDYYTLNHDDRTHLDSFYEALQAVNKLREFRKENKLCVQVLKDPSGLGLGSFAYLDEEQSPSISSLGLVMPEQDRNIFPSKSPGCCEKMYNFCTKLKKALTCCCKSTVQEEEPVGPGEEERVVISKAISNPQLDVSSSSSLDSDDSVYYSNSREKTVRIPRRIAHI